METACNTLLIQLKYPRLDSFVNTSHIKGWWPLGGYSVDR